jgi:hypothetical protein
MKTVNLLRSRLAERGQYADVTDEPPTGLAKVARAEISNRALRSSFFDPHLVCDPAWDMLLDLFLQQSAQRRVCVSSLCIASCAPSSTALRWIRALEEADLVERSRDPADGRRVFVRLTSVGNAKIAGYLAALTCPSCALTAGKLSNASAPN